MPRIPGKKHRGVAFENLSANQENGFFADGVQDEILTDLAKVADLKVISRTSVINYRQTTGRNLGQIGKELGVAHVLEGSVQRARESGAGQRAVGRYADRHPSLGADL